VPDPAIRRKKIVLQGDVPSPVRPPPGCHFHTRCPYAFDRCSRDDPVLLEVAPGRSAACWLQTGAEPPAPPATQARRLSLARAEG
jgi:oligopeptide/dipeptide ABC transporter ATP-binding protein